MYRQVLVVLAAAVLLASCGAAKHTTTIVTAGTNGSTGSLTLTSNAASLPATNWILANPTSTSAIPTIAFADGHVSGNGGCNQYSGSYKVDGDRITFGDVVHTQMACLGEGNDVEQRFFAAFTKVSRWGVTGDELVLSDSSGQALLHFRSASPIGTWKATGLLHNDAIRSLDAGTSITAELKADGSISGSAGCNSYRGTYSVSGSTLKISGVASTRMHCATPNGVMAQEQSFLSGLEQVAAYKLTGRGLTLLTSTGTIVATFSAAG